MRDILVVRTADRPDLVPMVAGWLWREFLQADGYTLEQVVDIVAGAVAHSGPPQCFVLLADGEPVGTATLAIEDLDERPDLTPWLAGVFVVPEERGQGHVVPLIDAVEAACRSASIGELWLYTNTAERVYARAGWRIFEIVQRRNKRPVMLMLRDLT